VRGIDALGGDVALGSREGSDDSSAVGQQEHAAHVEEDGFGESDHEAVSTRGVGRGHAD
jgi:hypothetical protein